MHSHQTSRNYVGYVSHCNNWLSFVVKHEWRSARDPNDWTQNDPFCTIHCYVYTWRIHQYLCVSQLPSIRQERSTVTLVRILCRLWQWPSSPCHDGTQVRILDSPSTLTRVSVHCISQSPFRVRICICIYLIITNGLCRFPKPYYKTKWRQSSVVIWDTSLVTYMCWRHFATIIATQVASKQKC